VDSVERKDSSNYLIVAVALILAGAFNIIDSVFYGVIFDDSHSQLATLFSEQPYGAYFHGKVVDMFYFHFGKEAS
jgi:signal peptidase II